MAASLRSLLDNGALLAGAAVTGIVGLAAAGVYDRPRGYGSSAKQKIDAWAVQYRDWNTAVHHLLLYETQREAEGAARRIAKANRSSNDELISAMGQNMDDIEIHRDVADDGLYLSHGKRYKVVNTSIFDFWEE